MTTCGSALGCDAPATTAVTILAPTGELIDGDPVLAPVFDVRLCDVDAKAAGRRLPTMVAMLGGHLDIEGMIP